MTKLLKALNGEKQSVPPLWMMRQAGRYLPEYLATRAQAGSFLDLCYNPELAVEVTMQPIRRFDFDAAILFSDILVIPHGLGQELWFEEGHGPRLNPLGVDGLRSLSVERAMEHLKPVFETVSGIRSALDSSKSLIGFCGAPWTVATYMIAGRGTPDQAPARIFAQEHGDVFQALLDMLVEVSIEYLCAQVDAGADVLQIFDSWAGVLNERDFKRYCEQPLASIVAGVKARHPDIKIILFPKGCGLFLDGFLERTDADGLGLDWTVPLQYAKNVLQMQGCIQGNLDPLLLIGGGSRLDEEIDSLIEAFETGPYIFNLGHGITPKTPIAHVEQMVERVRAQRKA